MLPLQARLSADPDKRREELEKLHDNFGHPRLDTFLKYLKTLGATETDLKTAELTEETSVASVI